MVELGYTLSSEEHAPQDLVRNAARAEAAGFDFLTVSDHYHPWVQAQGHSPFVWSVLGGVSAVTKRVRVGVGVTCPIIRVHPAIVAQAVATTSLLFEGRFFFGVGTGELLNEHVAGDRWPPPEIRLRMLEEAVSVMRELWTGETVDHHGEHYTVENARLFDPPSAPVPVIVSGFGEMSIRTAASIGDGYWGHSPDPEAVEHFVVAGGNGPRFAQINVCWAEDEAAARKTAYHYWPNAGVKGILSQDLPTWTHFEVAASMVGEDEVAEAIACGPAVGPVVESVQKFADAGYDHLHLHQVGPDQDGFFAFWEQKLRPALADAGLTAR